MFMDNYITCARKGKKFIGAGRGIIILLVLILSGCSNVKLSVNYSPDKVKMTRILIVTQDLPQVPRLNAAIAERIRKRLAKKHVEAQICLVMLTDSTARETEIRKAVEEYKPDCILTMMPSHTGPISGGFFSLNYNVELSRREDPPQKSDYYISGAMVIYYRDDRYSDIVKQAASRISRAVMGMQRYGCGC
jgi:hypothetical protein